MSESDHGISGHELIPDPQIDLSGRGDMLRTMGNALGQEVKVAMNAYGLYRTTH